MSEANKKKARGRPKQIKEEQNHDSNNVGSSKRKSDVTDEQIANKKCRVDVPNLVAVRIEHWSVQRKC